MSQPIAEQKARCYLFYVFDATLFANQRHYVHLGYMAALRDFDRAARYIGEVGSGFLLCLYGLCVPKSGKEYRRTVVCLGCKHLNLFRV